MKKTILVALILGLFTSVGVKAQGNVKIGYTNADYILSMMPEAKQVDQQLSEYQKQFTNQIQAKYQEFQSKLADYQQNSSTMVAEVRKDKEAELQNLQQSIQKFQKDAETAIQKKQQELYNPLYEKIQNAINEVAKENNYTHIFRAEAMLYVANEDGEDISNLVLKKLGVTPPADGAAHTGTVGDGNGGNGGN